ncbi:hypothetical protein U1Q18_043649 [Sarracenia purpurea var. burkii]
MIPISGRDPLFLLYLKVKIPDRAVLRTSCGEWEVKVGAGGRRFRDGWADFAKLHDLQVGDLLVFRHEGEMVFDVIVFDPSACERESYLCFDVSEMDSSEEQEQSSESVLPSTDFSDLGLVLSNPVISMDCTSSASCLRSVDRGLGFPTNRLGLKATSRSGHVGGVSE